MLKINGVFSGSWILMQTVSATVLKPAQNKSCLVFNINLFIELNYSGIILSFQSLIRQKCSLWGFRISSNRTGFE